MAEKRCCIRLCNSRSTRSEDYGVTYHKFPKDVTLCDIWIRATNHDLSSSQRSAFVCSRHFCKSDFQTYKDSKYVLKSGAVPSIFSWVKKPISSVTVKMETKEKNNSKESDGENLEAIKKFIEDQEKEISENNSSLLIKNEIIEDHGSNSDAQHCKEFDERLAVASSMMDVIISESEDKIAKKKELKSIPKNTMNTADKVSGAMSLNIGSKVEAKDFGEFWHPAKIVEVDYDEMEVLIHYENDQKRHDEWISVNSPRLRPQVGSSKQTSLPTRPFPVAGSANITSNSTCSVVIQEVPKIIEEKPKITFVAGERCLARWRDNRRFMATVNKELESGHYQIVFDDGFQWKCAPSRLYKVKESGAGAREAPNAPAQFGAGPSTLPAPAVPHTHLFDPTRDYLGSKSERREKKRKLNIKEIFNIGQKRKKSAPRENAQSSKALVVAKHTKVGRKSRVDSSAPTVSPVKAEIPDAVASIIGTIERNASEIEQSVLKVDQNKIKIKKVKTKMRTKEDKIKMKIKEEKTKMKIKEEKTKIKIKQEKTKIKIEEEKTDPAPSKELKIDNEDVTAKEDVKEGANLDNESADNSDAVIKNEPVPEDEVELEKFDVQDDSQHEDVIDRIKEVINKLEDGINGRAVENSPAPEVKEETVGKDQPVPASGAEVNTEKKKDKSKKLSKVKKGRKLRSLQEKKVKKQVEKVKCELEEMKKQVEEMRMQMLQKTEELSRSHQVEDKRLPPGWTKHMVRRSLGHSAGKWDVVLVSPDNKRFHTKTDMRNYMEQFPNPELQQYEHALMDFGAHLKLARRMGWLSTTPDGANDGPVTRLPAGTLGSTLPLVKRRKLSLKTLKDKHNKRKLGLPIRMPKYLSPGDRAVSSGGENATEPDPPPPIPEPTELATIEDGFVYVGSLKVQILENLLRCPAEGCYKNFRNDTLLKMHIKHYHRELRKMLGRTPKVLDLAYARTAPGCRGRPRPRARPRARSRPRSRPRAPGLEPIKVKITKPRKADAPRPPPADAAPAPAPLEDVTPKPEIPPDSPKLRLALDKPAKRPRVLLPVRPAPPTPPAPPDASALPSPPAPRDVPAPPTPPAQQALPAPPGQLVEPLDFEAAISTHTVTKPLADGKRRDKKRASTLQRKIISEDEEWDVGNSDSETRSGFPRRGPRADLGDLGDFPDLADLAAGPCKPSAASSESNEERKDSNVYMYTDTGERIKIVHMKREEIINCHCGFREEDGLMVQCELCLCWQHALCHNIQRESEVPDKYTCSICLNPRRGRRSARFLHDQDRLYEGLLPGARARAALRRSHDLSGNLLRARDALHALRVKYAAGTSKKDHPKLYLWAKDWENGELSLPVEKSNAEYSELNIVASSLTVKDDTADVTAPPAEELDKCGQGNQIASHSLSGLMSSPSGSLELPISTAELEKLATIVQEEVPAPQPEAAIEAAACRERLLRHIQRCQAAIDARLDSIEAQVAELESQDPSFEDDETADYFPRTKQTILMLMRDLETMEELGVIT